LTSPRSKISILAGKIEAFKKWPGRAVFSGLPTISFRSFILAKRSGSELVDEVSLSRALLPSPILGTAVLSTYRKVEQE
jgi:hypothetical protein